jgi:catechol 2,3-dioxygenase-like lactoylglutathione lyase family enzyme
MSKVYRISAVTLLIRDMKRSCNFYSKIPGLKKVYGGSKDTFTTYEIGENSLVYLNLELAKLSISDEPQDLKNLMRIILHTDDVDKLYSYFKNDQDISRLISFESKPSNGSRGERYFHIRDPDGHILSFAMTIKKSTKK